MSERGTEKTEMVWQLTSISSEHAFEVLLVNLWAVGGSEADKCLPDEGRDRRNLRRVR